MTVAHASEVLALDVEDLDLEARVTTATRNLMSVDTRGTWIRSRNGD